MYNKKLLSKIKMGESVKPNPYKKDIIVDPMGQWKHPGKNTRIPSSSITMKGVNYPVLGVSNTGQKQMMQPGKEYNFPGADYVDEYPQMAKGGAACPSGQKIYPDFKNFGCLTPDQYTSLKNQKTAYLNKKNAASKKIIKLKNAGDFKALADEIKKFETNYPNESYVCPGPNCPDNVLKVPIKPPVELEIKVPNKIDYDFSHLKLQGELPETELPQYNQYNYQAEIPTLDIKLPTGKIARLFDSGIIDHKGHIKSGKKEITRPIPSLVQKSTGYDPEYMEGYTDEEGNYIPGEIEKAQQERRRINFKGASSLKDLREQKRYNEEYDKIDNAKRLEDYYNKIFANKFYKAGGSSEPCPKGKIYDPVTKQCISEQAYQITDYIGTNKQNVGISYLPEDERSYYNPINDTIYLESDATDDILNHELVHAWQNRTGRLRTNPNLPQQRPPIVASDEQAASYYTRKGDDVDYYLNNLSTLYPDLTGGNIWTEDLNRFIPDQMKYDKVIDPLMYLDPNTMEGEAEYLSQTRGRPGGIGFRQNGGITDISIPSLTKMDEVVVKPKKTKLKKATGGQTNYNIGDEVDEATMQYLKNLGFTFEKI